VPSLPDQGAEPKGANWTALASPIRPTGFAPIGNTKVVTNGYAGITLSARPAGTTARSPIFPTPSIVRAGKKSKLKTSSLGAWRAVTFGGTLFVDFRFESRQS
jgi:hypothetical protein